MSFQFLSRFVHLRSCVLASASNVKQEAQIQMVVYTPGVLSQCVSTTCTARVLVWLCSRLLEGSPWVLCIVCHPFWQKSWKEVVFTFISTLFLSILKKQTHTTAKCMQTLPKSPGLMLTDCHTGLFKLLVRSDNTQPMLKLVSPLKAELMFKTAGLKQFCCHSSFDFICVHSLMGLILHIHYQGQQYVSDVQGILDWLFQVWLEHLHRNVLYREHFQNPVYLKLYILLVWLQIQFLVAYAYIMYFPQCIEVRFTD